METQLRAKLEHRAVNTWSHDLSDRAIATAYSSAGDKYIAYADGDLRQLFSFEGQYAYGDQRIWQLLDAKLVSLRATGTENLRVLDLGCGPGTWLRRVVTRARSLGFKSISARGLDIADGQIERARNLSNDLALQDGVTLSFEVSDILRPFPEQNLSVDLCLCLCGVLNHLETADHPKLLTEIARVTSGYFITTVRTAGSTPTVYVDAIERARRFRQDNDTDQLNVEFQNGRHVSLHSHLFTAKELRSVVTPNLSIEDLLGLDLFHGRFARDPRWNPPTTDQHSQFIQELDELESLYCRDLEFMDHATHLLLVAKQQTFEATRRSLEKVEALQA